MSPAGKPFIPYIPHDVKLPELTIKAIVLGIILAIVMGAANAYLGLYVGMTVSASIPAAVISMAILRPFKGNILENNAVKTMAAAGEALAAGIIFTIPALLVLHVWTEIDILVTTAAAQVGGFLGVIFTIPLRRVLIVDLDLPYPEGVACTEVLKTGEEGGKGMFYVFSSLVIGLLFRLAGSHFGLRLWEERVEGVWVAGSKTRFFGGFDLSPALLGVGFIIGPRVSGFILGGGILGWMILLPIAGAMNGYPLTSPATGDALTVLDSTYEVHRGWVIYAGIGMIIVGGLWTLFTMRGAIKKGIVEGIMGKKGKGGVPVKKIRTELDFPVQWWYFIIIGVSMFALYWYVTSSAAVAGVATFMMLLASFFFTAIAGYLAGVIGSSNNPISGVTVATLLFTALLMLGLGATGNEGMIATVVVAAIVCCSAAIAGDCMQELKTGQLLGSTPRALQISEFIGVLAMGLMIAGIVSAIHSVYVIGEGLPAPQAKVMASVVEGIFQGNMNWAWFGLGVAFAIGSIVFNHIQEVRGSDFQIPIMAVAIGIYLPLTLAVSIMLGGIIKFFTERYVHRAPMPDLGDLAKDPSAADAARAKKWELAEGRGILFSSGLIAGEALMGVIIAAIVLMGVDMHLVGVPAAWPGILLFFFVAFLLGYMALREIMADQDRGTITGTLKRMFRK